LPAVEAACAEALADGVHSADVILAEVDIGQGLPVRVEDDERLLKLTDGPGRAKAAAWEGHRRSLSPLAGFRSTSVLKSSASEAG
jgi:hypothetical protein